MEWFGQVERNQEQAAQTTLQELKELREKVDKLKALITPADTYVDNSRALLLQQEIKRQRVTANLTTKDALNKTMNMIYYQLLKKQHHI